jgi:hypothetical protein
MKVSKCLNCPIYKFGRVGSKDAAKYCDAYVSDGYTVPEVGNHDGFICVNRVDMNASYDFKWYEIKETEVIK